MRYSTKDFMTNLSEKKQATKDDLDLYRTTSRGRYVINLGDRFVALDPEDEEDKLDALELVIADEDNPLWDEATGTAEGEADLPDSVDHRDLQTSIKNQGDRGTCVCFASLACLEAIMKARSPAAMPIENIEGLDLSEQHANWLYMKKLGRNQCDSGLRTTLSARYLSEDGVPEEFHWPYEDNDTVRTHCLEGPSETAREKAIYGFDTYTIIDRLGLNGPSIANPAYLETLLHNGYDIVFGTHVAWGRPDVNDVLDVILDQYGNPLRSRGGHAMLIAGYDAKASIPYFIIKNSWGEDVGNEGYYYISYDYIMQYAKYGYIVHSIRTDMT